VPLIRKTILIVDDDETILNVLERELRKSGFAVLKAVNGKEALEVVSRHPVDIIVSDISMPEMDGLAFCERIRQNPELVDVPFIFLTVHDGEEERIRGLRSGADEYLVKPFKASDLITRLEILYDRILQMRSAGRLTGNLRDITLCDLLQLFEMTRKRGVLHVAASTGKGTLAVTDGALMDAAWNDLEGEDAVFEMFTLSDGSFRFQPKDVLSGNIAQPIGFVLMETARLTDELATFGSDIPAAAPLIVKRPFEGEDADAHLVSRTIAEGCTNAAAIRQKLPMSRVRLQLALRRLVEGGCVAAASDTATTAKAETKPAKILIAFTDHGMLARCLSLLGDSGGHPIHRSGVSDVSRVTVSSQVYDIFCLRGEKRFAFMWELVLKTSEGGIFILKTDEDKEHAAFFSARAACLQKPVVRVCFGANLRSTTGVRMVTTPEEMLQAVSALRMPAK
jgi:DNA-binding response OmpR family regulator